MILPAEKVAHYAQLSQQAEESFFIVSFPTSPLTTRYFEMTKLGHIIVWAAPPLTGKTTVLPLLRSRLGLSSIVLDNEVNGFTKAMRVKCAEASGLVLNSPDFAGQFNLRGQLDYQASARGLAESGHNVVMSGPFEDLTPDIAGRPLLQHMAHVDFARFNLDTVHATLWPDNDEHYTSENVGTAAGWEDIEEEIQNRRIGRDDDGGPQTKLDADKCGKTYYRDRVALVLRTIERFGTPHVKISIKDTPETVADKLFAVIDPIVNSGTSES